MSYTPTTWITDDVITSEKLNKIEQGLKNLKEPLIVHAVENDNTIRLDKTGQEILDSMPLVFLVRNENNEYSQFMVFYEDMSFVFFNANFNERLLFWMNNFSDYPQLDNSSSQPVRY